MHREPFEPAEIERLSSSLGRLLPHANLARIALTGGVAIQLHCHHAGCPPARTVVADVDFVATDVTAVSPAVSDSLLVSHFHTPQPGYPKFMVQLVDPATRIRIDVFPDLVGSIARAIETTVAGHSILVLDVTSILDHKLGGVARASTARPLDEKHVRDALLLGRLCGRHADPLPESMIYRPVYDKDLTPCARCEVSRSAEFPIAPRERVFEILGYN
jgi:hypothetical protein